MQCVLKSTAKRTWTTRGLSMKSDVCYCLSTQPPKKFKETPWDLCGFLLTLHCELMECWGKTNIGRENMRPALHKSSLLTVYDMGLRWPNIVPTTFASQNLQAFWDFVHPMRACWPCHHNFLLGAVQSINCDHWRQLQVLLAIPWPKFLPASFF